MNKRKSLLAVLGGVMAAALGTVFPSQAEMIDFGVYVMPGTSGLGYSGPNLQSSTALDLGGASLVVGSVGAEDKSGLAAGNAVNIMPTDLMYGSSPFPSFTNSWTDSLGVFAETLTAADSINRASANAITVEFSGMLNGPGFVNAPAFLILSASQAAGPGGSIVASFTTWAASIVPDPSTTGSSTTAGAIPEPSTWAMIVLGFAGLGFAGFRSRRRQRLQAIF